MMKHIKAYKIFESEDFDIEENIKELFFDLQDEGFVVKVEPNCEFFYKKQAALDLLRGLTPARL